MKFTRDRRDHTWARPEADMIIPDFFLSYNVCTCLIQTCTAKKVTSHRTDTDLNFVWLFNFQIWIQLQLSLRVKYWPNARFFTNVFDTSMSVSWKAIILYSLTSRVAEQKYFFLCIRFTQKLGLSIKFSERTFDQISKFCKSLLSELSLNYSQSRFL